MASTILYQGDKFQFIKRDELDSCPDWSYEPFSFLADALIKEPEVRAIFLDRYLKDSPPLLISDPNAPFSDKLLLPQSGYFIPETIILFRGLPQEAKLRELAKQLIGRKFLVPDKYSIIHCRNEDCGEFSVGTGNTGEKKAFFCTKCNTPALLKKSLNRKVTKVYTFSPELRDLLFRWRGRIIEGIIYRQCLMDIRIKNRFHIIAYPQLQITKIDESGNEVLESSKERDVVLIDKNGKLPPVVILASISSSQGDEGRQVQECTRLGLPTIFVCSRGVSEISSIKTSGAQVFDGIIADNNFPASLTNYIVAELIPQYEKGS